jgi:hypothetical protein
MTNSIIDKRWNTYSIILIIQALYSLKVWFLWWIPEIAASILLFVLSIFYFSYAPFWTSKDNKRIFAAVLLVFLFLYQAEGNLNAYILKFTQTFAIIPLIFLKTKYLNDLLEKFQRVITIILTISLAFWVLHLVGIDLPSTPITYGTVDRGQGLEDQYLFDNHYVFLVNQSWMLRSFAVVPDFLRFSSIFLEPGYLAILMVFLLFINRFDMKEKRNQLYIATIIATVSLAGALMGVFAYIAHSAQHAKRGILGVLLLLFVSFAGYNYFKDFNGGRNFINEGIIERLEYDDSKGITGNNRTTEYFDNRFDAFLTSSDLIGGIGAKKVKDIGGANVGYKAYIMRYGVIGLILFLSYLILIARIWKGYRALVLFIIYVLMFIRGDATIFWTGFMLVYVCGLAQSKFDSITHEKNSSIYLP